ncbi:HAUS augmin-like complex subunit 7 [Esox lucius]|uniref:HAUS augmin-like complex, subunit 7 n=1 Tax=Esox lucius TaxID=8010 RepID=A0A3P9AFX0_ESOLU|nr:HAUS augmin-like complex subunit 7 [Esox lucius]
MAVTSKAYRLSQHVYSTLQTLSCPLVEGLYLREAETMQELLCTPSQHRTDILAWICTRICPCLSQRLVSLRSKEPDALSQELAQFGQELMLCGTDDLDLITGRACPIRQLCFLEQLLTVVQGSAGPGGDSRAGGEGLLKELFSPEALPHLTHTLTPTLNPWPAQIRAAQKGQKSLPSRPRGEEVADVTALLESTRNTLDQLHKQCVFLRDEATRPSVFSVCALRVAVCDLAQIMGVFNRVYETDFRSYVNRDPPSLRPHTHTFRTVHTLLSACNTELEMLQQLLVTSVSLSDTVKDVHTHPRYWSRGHRQTLPTQLEDLTRRYRVPHP